MTYVNSVNLGGFRCYWDPKGVWNKAHGDNMSSVGGVFLSQTMKGADDMFHARVTKKREIILGPFI
jgi:hypothetical protein